MGKMDEPIIVVKKADLFGDKEMPSAFQGTERSRARVNQIIRKMADSYLIMRRGDAEENTEYKQPIPYAVLKQGDRYFTYQRLGGGGEKRLHGKLSIGVGGHMNKISDANDFHKVLALNLEREINEELRIEHGEQAAIETIGLINDDNTEVGKVHIGILTVLSLPSNAEVTVREKDKLEGSWKTLSELKNTAVFDRMESWSCFAIDALTAVE
ncbi:hypothetical protein M3N64_03495 [Sporolactobacillus sp. CPB3-1]|uniref:Nudix hydrolase domain-containing protein n=1 Tax=Sporolactobacillus mangiferae TaxID=2940498 RepID=A0ABT0M9R6_9BACL|nr:hypothetical protein [Sporolactobacillus mangiferae]MCL1631009.1 hypothetical protein [Sporolactobacillus mangiferae]